MVANSRGVCEYGRRDGVVGPEELNFAYQGTTSKGSAASSSHLRMTVERRHRLAVRTRTGHLVHAPDTAAQRPATTLCGREWVDLNYADVALSAVTCAPCKRRLAA